MDSNQFIAFTQIQKKQIVLTVALSALAMTVGAFLSAFILSSVYHVKSVYAAPSSMPTSAVLPSDASSDVSSSACVLPGSQQGGMGSGALMTSASSSVTPTTNFQQVGNAGGGAVFPMGGHGAGAIGSSAPGFAGTITKTLTFQITKYENSNNSYGSNNGNGNTTSTTSIQGSYNTAKNLSQVNAAYQSASNTTTSTANKDGNTIDSNNSATDSNNSVKNVAKDSGNTTTVDSGNTAQTTNESNTTTNTTKDSNNTTTINKTPSYQTL